MTWHATQSHSEKIIGLSGGRLQEQGKGLAFIGVSVGKTRQGMVNSLELASLGW